MALLDSVEAVFRSLQGAFSVTYGVTYVTNAQTCNVCNEGESARRKLSRAETSRDRFSERFVRLWAFLSIEEFRRIREP